MRFQPSLRLSTMPLTEARSNIAAGLVVGVIAIPLSIALAVAIGVPPEAGLYTAAFAGAVAAVAGGSRFNITGPTAALVPILASAVITHGAGALPTIGVLAGLMLFAMSYFKLGRLLRFMPGVVVVGFTAGIALSIAFGQLNNLLAISGTDPRLEHFHEKLIDTASHASSASFAAITLGVATVAGLLAWPRLPGLSRVPGPLVAVVAGTAITWGLGIDVPTLGSRYGSLSSAFPTPTFDIFDLGLMLDVFPIAVSVAILGGVESLLSAMVADGMATGLDRHQPNRELFGQGLANIVSPVFGGIPATAAIARTAAGIRNGATSRLTGVVHALTVLAATLALGGLASHVPLTVLAAILLVVAWNIAEVPEVVKLVRRAPRSDSVVLLATAAITVLFDLTYAIGAGILTSMVLLIRSMMRVPAVARLVEAPEAEYPDVSQELREAIAARPDVTVFNAQGILSFHSASAFEMEIGAHDERPLVLRMRNVQHIDTSGLITLEEVVKHRKKAGGRVLFSKLSPEVRASLTRFGIIEAAGPGSVFATTVEAIAACPPPPTSSPPHSRLAAPHPA
jgi:SulP family sulfate permease